MRSLKQLFKYAVNNEEPARDKLEPDGKALRKAELAMIPIERSSMFLQLPMEIVLKVAACLPAWSVKNLRLVCKALNAIVSCMALSALRLSVRPTTFETDVAKLKDISTLGTTDQFDPQNRLPGHMLTLDGFSTRVHNDDADKTNQLPTLLDSALKSLSRVRLVKLIMYQNDVRPAWSKTVEWLGSPEVRLLALRIEGDDVDVKSFMLTIPPFRVRNLEYLSFQLDRFQQTPETISQTFEEIAALSPELATVSFTVRAPFESLFTAVKKPLRLKNIKLRRTILRPIPSLLPHLKHLRCLDLAQPTRVPLHSIRYSAPSELDEVWRAFQQNSIFLEVISTSFTPEFAKYLASYPSGLGLTSIRLFPFTTSSQSDVDAAEDLGPNFEYSMLSNHFLTLKHIYIAGWYGSLEWNPTEGNGETLRAAMSCPRLESFFVAVCDADTANVCSFFERFTDAVPNLGLLRILPLRAHNSHVTPLSLAITALQQYVEPVIGDGDHFPPTKLPVLPAAVHIHIGDLDVSVSITRKLEQDQDEEGKANGGRCYVYGAPELIKLASCDSELRFLDSEDRSDFGNLFYYTQAIDTSNSDYRDHASSF
ncbi:hypothetical protein FA15DRAFT_753948 [Coprinopsis marcescibilis]|uniref:F-box domain-containing protein n=1 Tax=Coprinopsis marcescibilis TaxID=230819 RepID=A0A5C3L400_COPMA|nr:hypothetical protein FA15DRAFT_753948 [Coprinopsis marcescibilis]